MIGTGYYIQREVIYINEDSLRKITTLHKGLQWNKEGRKEAITAKRGFFLPNEQPNEDKNGARREILPGPWDEVACHILKYISYEVILNIVYAHQFRLFYQLRFQARLLASKLLSIPFLLLRSLNDMSAMVKEGKHNYLAHHVLIKLIFTDALEDLQHSIPWIDFVDMDR